MNRVILIGNLGKDPEVRNLEGGSKVVKFTLATNEQASRNGEKIKITEWHDIELWDKQADIAEKYLRKGSKVMIEGKIKTDSWKDQQGVDKQRKVIRGQNIELLDKSDSNTGISNDRTSPSEQRSEQEGFTPVSNMESTMNDDLPF
ncbi:MAG: single-stranded DNA-binding protein [Bacteroidetes bacterium]|nr:single-stranded DNA-binding protein [Bacteroidota bacterium]